ncbi:Clock-controlled protein 6 [Golovinomyces cichoracearum]|uniref:Clock-controlled protein 6 n=1 Tax=Golovinomyces cichoracearum TaxID=62708 RepID=A0A420IYJ5_9PEZI|nr:Clock-controlled protein 6 [Golovinomyces cichoracearum]
MLLSFAVISALAIAVSASLNNATVYVTEIHTAYTTVCPTSTQFVYNGVTYTATESTTLTITNCPCTVLKPVYTTSSVHCTDCYSAVPTAPIFGNTTAVTPNPIGPKPNPTGAMPNSGGDAAVGTGPDATKPKASQTHITTSNGNRLLTYSGAYMAGFLCLLTCIF